MSPKGSQKFSRKFLEGLQKVLRRSPEVFRRFSEVLQKFSRWSPEDPQTGFRRCPERPQKVLRSFPEASQEVSRRFFEVLQKIHKRFPEGLYTIFRNFSRSFPEVLQEVSRKSLEDPQTFSRRSPPLQKIPRTSPEASQPLWSHHQILTMTPPQPTVFFSPFSTSIPPPAPSPIPAAPGWSQWEVTSLSNPSQVHPVGRYLLGSSQSRLLEFVVAVLGVSADGHPCKRRHRGWWDVTSGWWDVTSRAWKGSCLLPVPSHGCSISILVTVPGEFEENEVLLGSLTRTLEKPLNVELPGLCGGLILGCPGFWGATNSVVTLVPPPINPIHLLLIPPLPSSSHLLFLMSSNKEMMP